MENCKAPKLWRPVFNYRHSLRSHLWLRSASLPRPGQPSVPSAFPLRRPKGLLAQQQQLHPLYGGRGGLCPPPRPKASETSRRGESERSERVIRGSGVLGATAPNTLLTPFGRFRRVLGAVGIRGHSPPLGGTMTPRGWGVWGEGD